MVLQKQPRVHEQVVEVERVGGLQALLQALVHARRHLSPGVVRVLGEVAGHDELVFGL